MNTSCEIVGARVPMLVGALVVYADLAAGQRAVQLLDRLVHRSEPGIELRIHPWRFASINDAEGRAMAEDDFPSTNMLVISTASDSRLPASIADWMRQCLSIKPGKSVAVVALLGTSDNINLANSSLFEQLQGLVRDAGQDLFASGLHSGLSIDRVIAHLHGQSNSLTGNTNRQGLHMPPTSFDRIDAVQHWGINE